ncbi:MAG: c-type cytochrome [Arenicella sp.]
MFIKTQLTLWSIASFIALFALILGLFPDRFWSNPAINIITDNNKSKINSRLAKGQYLYEISGCAACHNGTSHDAKELSGGRRLKTPFGTLITPNITPSKSHGIGNWNDQQFIDAMTIGLSPQGRHYFAAFPFTSYKHMPHQDLVDLKLYIDTTIAAVNASTEERELTFPFNIRLAQGLWKWLYLDKDVTFVAQHLDTKELRRGAYLTESLGHCGECHTPRDTLGGLKKNRWLAGVPIGGMFPSAPNITPHADGIGSWSIEQTKHALKTGKLPNGKTMGGEMGHVVTEITSNLNNADLNAMAKYLHHIEPLPSQQ